MFDNKCKVASYNYSIDLSTPIEFFCKLIQDIGSHIISDYKIEDIFNAEFINDIGFRFDEFSTIDDVASNIAEFYNQKIINDVDLSNTDILLVYKAKNIFFGFGNESKQFKSTISTLIKNRKLIDNLISKINHEGLRNSVQRIQSLRLEDLFNNIVDVKEKKFLSIPYIPFSFLAENHISVDFLDEGDVWINRNKFKKEFNIELNENLNASILNNSNEFSINEIGLKCNEIVFPITSEDLSGYIKEEAALDYYWILFKEVFKYEKRRVSGYDSDLLQRFKLDMVNPKLNNVLSYLEFNHCLDEKRLNSFKKFKVYFEEVSKISELEHVKQFQFYVTHAKGKTALGIYSTERIKDNYNLIHWIKSNNSNEHEFYRNSDSPKKAKVKKIFTFKPEIAFYFLTNYFEDLLEKTILEIGNKYIKNFELYVNDTSLGEFDFLLKTSNKICFIEAKTKLTDQYIEDYIIKCDTLINYLKPIIGVINVEFYIISAYSDPSCERKRYFMESKTNYNERRDSLKTMPYYYKVPIPRHSDALLTCIAEPDFPNLKSLMQEICQK